MVLLRHPDPPCLVWNLRLDKCLEDIWWKNMQWGRISAEFFPPFSLGRVVENMGSGERWEANEGSIADYLGPPSHLTSAAISPQPYSASTVCMLSGTGNSFLRHPVSMSYPLFINTKELTLYFLHPLTLGVILGSSNGFMFSRAMSQTHLKLQHYLLPPCSPACGPALTLEGVWDKLLVSLPLWQHPPFFLALS